MSIANAYELDILKKLKEEEPWIQLHTGDPGENCTNNVAATTARKKVQFEEPSNGAMGSTNQQLWTGMTATENITHVSLWKEAVAGPARWYGPLEEAVEVIEGENFEFQPGDVIVTLD